MLGMYESTYIPKDFNAIPDVVTAWAGPRLANGPICGTRLGQHNTSTGNYALTSQIMSQL